VPIKCTGRESMPLSKRPRHRESFKTWRRSGTKDKVCVCCNSRRVDINNILLCKPCHQLKSESYNDPAFELFSHPTRKYLTERMNKIIEDQINHIPTKQYSCSDYTQEELQQLIDECR